MEDFNRMLFGTLGIIKDLAEEKGGEAIDKARELYYERPADTGFLANEALATGALAPAALAPAKPPVPLAPLYPSFTHPPANLINHPAPAALYHPPIIWDDYTTVIPISDDKKKYLLGLTHRSAKTGINPTFI
jgi:hypothetical protein